jgi:hypothetical protein
MVPSLTTAVGTSNPKYIYFVDMYCIKMEWWSDDRHGFRMVEDGI